jgi:hypothetical protein
MRAWLSLLFLAVGCSTSNSSPSSGGTEDASIDPSREPILDGGGDVPASPNGEDLCPTGICNYQTGKGCGEGGASSCVPLPSSAGVAPACEAAGSAAIGSPCMQWTDCVSGAVCAQGKCAKLCCGKDWNGCPEGQHCLSPFKVQVPAGDVVSSEAYLCVPVNQCDALVPSSCSEAKTTCQIADGTGATACLPDGTGEVGAPCPCKGGYSCVGDKCRRLCKAVAGGGEPSCPIDEGRCVHFNRDPAGVGECTPL